MQTLKLKDDFYWTGIVDRGLRNFDIIMSTEYGTTYNSYVLKAGDQTILFETAKAKFYDEYLEELKGITEIENINYLVVDHTEPDHAGSLEFLLDLNPNMKIIATSCAINFLKNIVNRDFYSIPIKDNETMNIGGKTLRFMVVPNLHWPDTMYTYIEEDKILFTCDSFGAHYGVEGILRSQVKDEAAYQGALKYYFDCIMGPFKPYVLKAVRRVRELDVDLICTGHGPVLDTRIEEVLDHYEKWGTVENPNTEKTVIIPYVSAYGYTKTLADEITEGLKESGPVAVRCYDMVEANQDKVLGEIEFADGILFGTPTIVGEALKPIWDLTTSVFAVTHGGKIASAFGSYGWSGEGVPHLIERLKQLKMKVPDNGFRVKFKPGEVDLMEAREYGYRFGCLIQGKEYKKKKPGVRTLVKCLVCGEIFDSSMDTCPVCGVGREYFVPVEADEITFRKDSNDLFVILGNGVAGLSAAEAVRDRNRTASIVMVSQEPFDTYNRPMLTKSMMAGLTPEQIAVHEAAWYEDRKITRMLGSRVVQVDGGERQIVLEDGTKLAYTKLIYALGADCFIPPFKGADRERVLAVRSLSDVQEINRLISDNRKIAVIGGGVLGLETAWEFRKSKCEVTVIEAAPRLMMRQLDEGAGVLLEKIAASEGITVYTDTKVVEIVGDDTAKSQGPVTGVLLEDGTHVAADLVIISAGIRASLSLAGELGLETERAVVVNERMETNLPDVYACGDCAQYDGMNYGIWPVAVEQGKTAGANAAGDDTEYEVPSLGVSFHGMNTSLYSIGDIGTDKKLSYRTMEIKDEAKRKYEKYYYVNQQLKGAILIGDLSKMAEVTEEIQG